LSKKQKILLFVLLAVVASALGKLFLNSPIAHFQLAAEPVFKDVFGMWDVTNSLIAAWVAIGIVLVVAFRATRHMTLVPTGRLQGLVESIIGFFADLTESMAGAKWGRVFLPLIATLFIFIAVANWSALLPVFGTVGKVEPAEEVIAHNLHKTVDELNKKLTKANPSAHEYELVEVHDAHAEMPYAKPDPVVVAAFQAKHGTDRLNIYNGDSGPRILPPGFRVVNEMRVNDYWDFEAWEPHHGVVDVKRKDSIIQVDITGKTVGRLVPYLRSANTDLMNTLALALVAMVLIEFWGIKANGFMGYGSRFINIKAGPIGIFVGFLEIIGEIARIISFSFRLLGNMFAGEILLFSFVFLLPVMVGIGILPFFMETAVGVIQAVVFAALALVFASMAVASHEAGHDKEHGAEAHEGH